MKKIIFKVILLTLIFGIYFIPPTNSSFIDQETSQNNSFTAGCWGAPDEPTKISPDDFSTSHNINFSWSATTNHCPASQTFYNLQIFTDSSAQTLYYQSSWITNNFFSLNNLADGRYWWRVQTKDENGYTNNSPSIWQLTIDSTRPTSTITKPWNSDHDHDVIFPIVWFWDGQIEGTATDNLSGIDHVELFIYRQIVDKHWNGHAWVNGNTDELVNRVPASTTNNWSNWSYQVDPLYIPFGKFKIVAHAVDKAGNVENSATIEFEYAQVNPPCQPDVQLTSNNGRASFTATCISNYSKLDYELTYLSDNLEKGIDGLIDLNNQSQITRDNLILGSCSALGESCSYDPNITNLKLKVDLISQNGETVTITKQLP